MLSFRLLGLACLGVLPAQAIITEHDPDNFIEDLYERLFGRRPSGVGGVGHLIEVVADALELVQKRYGELICRRPHDAQRLVFDQMLDIAGTGEAHLCGMLGDDVVCFRLQARGYDFGARGLVVCTFASHQITPHESCGTPSLVGGPSRMGSGEGVNLPGRALDLIS